MAISFEERKKRIMRERQREVEKQSRKQQIPRENVRLTKKQKQKARNRAKRKIKRRAILVALGITGVGAVVAGTKLLPEGQQEPSRIEGAAKNFRDFYKVNENDLLKGESEVEKEINELQNSEDVLNYLKNMYIEKYEQKTGDETLMTDNIKIIKSSQNYVYIDDQTGDIITHGELPELTIKALEENGISDDNIEYDVDIYRIEKNDGEIIDMMAMGEKDGERQFVRAVSGNEYNEMKDYESVLVESGIGEIIKDGMYYMENFEDENAKKEFINSIEEAQSQETTQDKQIEDDGMELE